MVASARFSFVDESCSMIRQPILDWSRTDVRQDLVALISSNDFPNDKLLAMPQKLSFLNRLDFS